MFCFHVCSSMASFRLPGLLYAQYVCVCDCDTTVCVIVHNVKHNECKFYQNRNRYLRLTNTGH